MTYQINLTNGSLLTEIVDSSIDQIATDITLIGKNVSGYGEYINENFIKILENFANESAPNNPLVGQIWFDTAENRLKVYDGSGFRIGAGPIVSGTQPLSLSQGDIWIDSVQNQLYFYDGVDLRLAGPIYKDAQGQCGFIVEDILDTDGAGKTIVKMYVKDTLLGIYSSDTLPFTPSTSIPGFSGDIYPGFNQGSLPGIKWRVTSTLAEGLVDVIGNVKTPANFMKTDENTATTGTVSIVNSAPLLLGTDQNVEITTDVFSTIFQNNSLNANYRVRVRNNAGYQEPITVLTATKKFGIFKTNPAYTLDVGGDCRITGNLIVNGETTSISTTNLSIQDHQIELALNDDSSVSDNYANQGGIVLKGTTDHTLLWDQPTTAWRASENFDLTSASGTAVRSYRINGQPVITFTGSIYELGAAISSAPGITSIGPQTSFVVDNLSMNDNTITAIDGPVISGGSIDIRIEPKGAGNVELVGSPRITGLDDPVFDTDATNKQYVDNYVRARNICLSMDITGLNNTQISDILEQIAPASYYELGTQCNVHCTQQVVSYPAVAIATTVSPVVTGDIVKEYIDVDKSDNAGPQPSEPVLKDITVNPFNLGTATITVTRINKRFVLTSDSTTAIWQHVLDY
jgi:hypothetical protein